MTTKLIRHLLLLGMAVSFTACSTIDFNSYNWDEDPNGWLNKYRVYQAQPSTENAPHWVLKQNQPQQVGLLPLTLDARLTDSQASTSFSKKVENKWYDNTQYQPALSYAATNSTMLLTQLQPLISEELRHFLPTAPEFNDQLPWNKQHMPDIFWGTANQFRFVHGALAYGYLDCAFPISAPCKELPQHDQPVDPWQLDGFLTAQQTTSENPRYLFVMNWNPRSKIYEQHDSFSFDVKPTGPLLNTLSNELAVSHWLMLQLSVADVDQWLKVDANGFYQQEFALQALLLNTEGKIEQAKISPFTLRWHSNKPLLSQDELHSLQPSWQPALQHVLEAFGLVSSDKAKQLPTS